jgi:hypothetical protein
MWYRGDNFSCGSSVTKAMALRNEMRRHWSMPDEKQFVFSGPDWLLSMLSSVDADTKV